MEEPALPRGQFVQQIGKRCEFAARKRRAAGGVGHAAAYVDQVGHAPGALLPPWRVMLRDNGFKLRGHLPIRDQLPAGLAMVPSEELPLGLENAGGRTSVNPQQEAELFGPDHGQRQSPDVVHDARGKRHVPVEEAHGSQLVGNQGTGQVVAPDSSHARLVQRFAHVRAYAHCQTEPLQVIGAQHRDSLQDAAGGESRSIEQRIRDGKNLAGKGRVGRDQLAQLVQLHVLLVGQLQNPEGDLRKRRKAEMGPGRNNRLAVLPLVLQHWSLPSTRQFARVAMHSAQAARQRTTHRARKRKCLVIVFSARRDIP